MAINKKTLTAANCVLLFRCEGIYDSYVQLTGFQADNIFNFGGIQTGVALSEQQKSIINNEAGVDAATIIFNQGYYLMIRDATAQVRAARGSFPIKLWYTDGSSVHSINIASINVQ